VNPRPAARAVRSGNRHVPAARLPVVHQVLLAESDPAVAAFARRVLRGHGIGVDVTPRADVALQRLEGEHGHDAVILAGSLQDGSGYDVCRRLREDGAWLTILLLVDVGDTVERARASGADGYLRKPFTGAKLLTTVQGLTDEAEGCSVAGLSAGGIALDPTRRSVARGGVDVRLSPTEFSLLELLVRHAGEVVERPRLLEHAWSYDYDDGSNVVEVYLRRLRDKVDRPFGTDSIETVRGRGYRLRSSDA
jgi:two-component system OmpR family response regulator